MEPVGMTKACTSVVVPNRRRMMVTVHSAMNPRCGSAFPLGDGSVSAGGAVTVFELSTFFYCTGVAATVPDNSAQNGGFGSSESSWGSGSRYRTRVGG